MNLEPAAKKTRSSEPEQDDLLKKTEDLGSLKRTDCLSWEDYFMALAFLSAQRSKDPKTQVGSVIINSSNKVIGTGYNGLPIGISDDEFPWGKDDSKNPLNEKSFYVCHAELNAILNSNSANTKDCRLYTSLFPCSECAKCIIQSEIKEVIYASDKKSEKKKTIASKRLLTAAGVKYRQFKPIKQKIVIDFSSMD